MRFRMNFRFFRISALMLCTLSVCACAPRGASLEPGYIPEGRAVTKADEDYGAEVAYQLSRQFPLDNDPYNNETVRRMVKRLSRASGSRDPWRIYVYESRDFKNAAATRGNYVFVWTPLLNFVRSDGELAAVLSHEMGHVLAGHTDPNPVEESKYILSGIAGQIGKGVVGSGGGMGLGAGIAGMAIEEGLKAVLVNPGRQQSEYDADQIGLFLMADAGYDPEEALTFWKRAARDPDLAGSPIDILSSHPSSSSRLKQIEALLPEARDRYRYGPDPYTVRRGSTLRAPSRPSDSAGTVSGRGISPVFESNSLSSIVIGEIPPGTPLRINDCRDRWCEIVEPVPGYIRESDLERR